jgi:hypothetical protein
VLAQKIKPNQYPLVEGSHGVAHPYSEPTYVQYVNYDLALRDKLNDQYRRLAAKHGKRTPMVIGLGDLQAFKAPKLFLRLSADRLTATYSSALLCADLSLYIITLPNKRDRWNHYDLKYFLALLNSSTLCYYAKTKGIIRNLNTGTPQIRLKDVRNLPIRTINFSNPSDKSSHDRVIRLVNHMLELHKQLAAARTADNKIRIQRQIDTTDVQID